MWLAPGREDQGRQTRRAFSETGESKPEIQAARRQPHHNRLARQKRRKTWHERARLCATKGLHRRARRREGRRSTRREPPGEPNKNEMSALCAGCFAKGEARSKDGDRQWSSSPATNDIRRSMPSHGRHMSRSQRDIPETTGCASPTASPSSSAMNDSNRRAAPKPSARSWAADVQGRLSRKVRVRQPGNKPKKIIGIIGNRRSDP